MPEKLHYLKKTYMVLQVFEARLDFWLSEKGLNTAFVMY